MARVSVLKIAITTGDTDGVGLEVTLKALAELKPQPGVEFIVFRGDKLHASLKTVDRRARKAWGPQRLKFIEDDRSPADWVEDAARACLAGEFHALVTAPLSKETIRASGRQAIGHTDILREVSGASHVYMTFLGRKFNVMLVTGHIPLKKVSEKLTSQALGLALEAAGQLRSRLGGALAKKPLALVGLNPHAGEKGIIGPEEGEAFAKALKSAKENGLPVKGPLVPDAAFLPQNWPLYSLYVCPYHDQGLIPFKMIHGHDEGVHLSHGLPFVRTSVDHGTAKDIFGQNKARPGSMKDALLWAVRLAKGET